MQTGLLFLSMGKSVLENTVLSIRDVVSEMYALVTFDPLHNRHPRPLKFLKEEVVLYFTSETVVTNGKE